MKRVRSIYPKLDLSKISMDDPLPTTPVGGDSVSEETNDSTQLKWDPKDDGVVLTQLAIEGPVIPLALSAKDPPTPDALNFAAQDAPHSAQNTQNPTDQDTLYF